MTVRTRTAAFAAAMAIACTPLPAQAAGCWSTQDVAAAKVRDLQTMLMVATLRCRAGGMDVSAAYNAFVAADRAVIAQANDRLRAHFVAAGGDAQAQYDRFTTALANAYGADDTGGDVCSEAAALSAEASAAASVDGLTAIAERRMLSPTLPGAMCAMTLASADPQH